MPRPHKRGTFARVRRPPSLSWVPLAALIVLVAFALGAPEAVSASRIGSLRRQADQLTARTHRALLDLYALQSQLVRARARLASVHAEVRLVRAQRALVQRQVIITRRAYVVSRQQLAVHLRGLYESSDVDTLAVLLGSSTLDRALTNIDALHRLAAQSKNALIQTTVAGRQLRRLTVRLDQRIARLALLEHSARRATASLESARVQRLALIGSLQTKERFSRRAIASIETAARAAEVKSQHLAAAAPSARSSGIKSSPPLSPTPDPAPAPTSASSSSSSSTALTVVATGYSIHGHTATGVTTGWGVAAVDPAVIPLGTRFTVPGYGVAVAADVGSGVRGATIDLWFPTVAGARLWGRKTVTITIDN